MNMELRSRAIDKIYKRRDRIEIPDFQREEVWSVDKKRKLLNSILRGWHLPKFYFRVVDEGEFECVDGQHRVIAIWEFYDGKLTLDEDSAREFGGNNYDNLPDTVSDNFDDFEIEIEEIADTTDEELEDLFLRLQLATPLNTAEKLNAIGGELRNFAKEVARHTFFTDRIALRDTRYAYFMIVVQWLFVESRGVQPQMRFPQQESLLRENRRFSRNSELAKRTTATLEYLEQAMPSRNNKLRNRANVLTVLMLASRVVNVGLQNSTAPLFGRFVDRFFSELAEEVEKGASSIQHELLEYQGAISYGSTGGDSIRTRLRIITRRLVTQHHEFAPLLGDAQEHKNSTGQAIVEQAQTISRVLYEINENYSTVYGEDLFKMTNESHAALETMAIPAWDADQYEKLIDALYKVFYEGSGACKRLPSPPPQFTMDVKFLRTGIRHDLDHGPETEVSKKRIRKGEVFKKYSGKQSVGECAPEDFIATHLRLTDTARIFLDELSAVEPPRGRV